MRRMIRYSNLGAALGEVYPNDVMALVRTEEINGEHSLEITTTQVISKNERIIFQDGRGYWREYVVVGVDELHSSGKRPVGTYYCVWSLMPDMLGVTVSKMPGVQAEVSAGTALDAIISEQSLWTRGTVTQTTTGGASMYDMSGWKALDVLLNNWGGEIGTTIEVSPLTGVTKRSIDLYAQMGQAKPTRRFDFGSDLKSVKRTIPDEPYYCRISPRGKGEQTSEGGYGRKIRITEVNDGKDYLEYTPMVDVAKLPADGGWQYPTLIVENSDMETPAELKEWAQGILEETLTPKATYEVDVVQAGAEGFDFTGVSLGDVVQVVDRYFTEDGLRLEGRVTSVTVDELNEHNVKVKIGYLGGSFADNFAKLQSAAQAAYDTAMAISSELSSADYISSLLDRINAEINATGGYTYITEGQGLRTYDVAVSDPLVGSEASMVVEVKGGTIRIANSKTSGGAWEWKTLLQSGFIAANLINAVNVKAGRIESADGSSYWDLDGSHVQLAGDLDLVMEGYKTGAKHHARMGSTTGYDVDGNTITYNGLEVYSDGEDRADSKIIIAGRDSRTPVYTAQGYKGRAAIYSDNDLQCISVNNSAGTYAYMQLYSSGGIVLRAVENSSNRNSINLFGTQTHMYGKVTFIDGFTVNTQTTSYLQDTYANGTLTVNGTLVVKGTKPRLVETPHYSDRLIYAYETPAPYFGDIGSATTDENGECYIALDDIFAETVNAKMGYQVFLQPCGEGVLYVSDKQPGYFVVRGTPNIAFDWEIKAHQRDYEATRTECHSYNESMRKEQELDTGIEDEYSDEYDYVEQIERIAYEAA